MEGKDLREAEGSVKVNYEQCLPTRMSRLAMKLRYIGYTVDFLKFYSLKENTFLLTEKYRKPIMRFGYGKRRIRPIAKQNRNKRTYMLSQGFGPSINPPEHYWKNPEAYWSRRL